LTTTAVNILTATVSGLFVAIPSIITTVLTANSREKVQEERMKQMNEKLDTLTEKVEKHNQFETRISVLEQAIKDLRG
jgi:biopolymer transport protein ExbB/TolQ